MNGVEYRALDRDVHRVLGYCWCCTGLIGLFAILAGLLYPEGSLVFLWLWLGSTGISVTATVVLFWLLRRVRDDNLDG